MPRLEPFISQVWLAEFLIGALECIKDNCLRNWAVPCYNVRHDTHRPVESHSGAREIIITGPYHSPPFCMSWDRTWGEVSPHHPIRGSGSVVSSPSGVRGSPKIDFMHILGQKEAIWNTIFSIFERRWGPKRCGARENFPPFPPLLTGLDMQNFGSRDWNISVCFVRNFFQRTQPCSRHTRTVWKKTCFFCFWNISWNISVFLQFFLNISYCQILHDCARK